MPMDIIIRRLPEATTRDELFEFAAKALGPKWYLFQFSPLASITDCEIYKVSDSEDNVIAYNGLIHVESDEAADRLVERLNSQHLKHYTVDAAIYKSRSKRDRRLGRQVAANSHHYHSRSGDRRTVESQIERL